MKRRPVTKAIFPVAGLGTRFLPATKSIPKEILTLVDRPLIDYAIEEAREAGIEEFIFVTARGKSALEDYFDAAPQLEQALGAQGKDDLLAALHRSTMPSGSIAYIRQHQALGLGHAILCARGLVARDESVAVLLPDDVIRGPIGCLRQMATARETLGGTLVATMEVAPAETSQYGVLDVAEASGRLLRARGLVEKPQPGHAPSNQAVIGRYILAPEVLHKNLPRVVPGAGGEIQLTDAIAMEIEQGRAVHGFQFEGERFDCGSKLGYLKATLALALEREDFAADFASYAAERLAAREFKA